MSASHPVHAIAVRWLTGQSRHTGSLLLLKQPRHQLLTRTLRTATHPSSNTSHYTTIQSLPSIRLYLKKQNKNSDTLLPPREFSSTAQNTQQNASVVAGVFNTPRSLRRRIKQGFWVGLGLGTVVSAVGIAWSPSYREQATIYSAAVFRSVATFVTG